MYCLLLLGLLALHHQAQVLQLEFEATETHHTLRSASTIQVDDAGKMKEVAAGKAEPTKLPVTKTEKYVVRLGKDSFDIETAGTITHYDFTDNQITMLNTKTKEYQRSSIHAQVLFRGMELQNRQFLKGILGKIQQENSKEPATPQDDPRELEASFGLLIKDQPNAEVSTTTSGQKIQYHIGEKARVEFIPSASTVPEAYRNSYRLWITHRLGLHPAIRQKVLEKNQVPEILQWKVKSLVDDRDNTLKLVKTSEVPATPWKIPADYREHVEPKNPVSAMLSQASKKIENHKRPTLQELEAAIQKAEKDDKPLDVFLIVINDGLSYSDSQAPQALRKSNALRSKNEQLQQFVQIMGNKHPPEECVNILNKIDRTGLTHAFVLETQLGSMKMNSPKRAEAIDHYLKAIEGNPQLTGAYVDLGKVLQSQYRVDEAWICWELARRISPNHGMVKEFVNLENLLLKNHSEFYLPASTKTPTEK